MRTIWKYTWRTLVATGLVGVPFLLQVACWYSKIRLVPALTIGAMVFVALMCVVQADIDGKFGK